MDYYDDNNINKNCFKDWNSTHAERRKKIKEFKDSVNREWAKERRIEYIKLRMPIVEKDKSDIEFLIEKNKALGYDCLNPVLVERLSKINRKYKKWNAEIKFLNSGERQMKNFISDEIIQLCREIDVSIFIEDEILDIGNGRKKSRCPFHNDKTPSFVMYENNGWHCFGCGVHGKNAIDFIMKKHNYSFVDAVQFLKNYN